MFRHTEYMMNRRQALKMTTMTALGTWAGAGVVRAGGKSALKLGVASYSLTKESPEEVIATLKELQIRYVSLYRTHCPWDGTAEECQAAAKKFTDAGLTVTGSGVINLPNNEVMVHKAFTNARAVDLPMMVCKPALNAFPLVEKYVKQFDIRLGIHNHGPGDTYPSPYDVWKAVQPYDKRIGLCIDVGHTARAGTDPAEAIRKCRERLYDIHLKDSLAAAGAHNDIPIEVGRGHLDIKGILAALMEIEYPHIVAFEYEKSSNQVAGLTESVAYVRKILAA
jgi:inosose dehydratase